MSLPTNPTPNAPSPHTDQRSDHRFAQHTSSAMLAVGSLLVVLGFWVAPRGSIHESVLWVFAQCLIYAASVLGVGSYVGAYLRAKQAQRG